VNIIVSVKQSYRRIFYIFIMLLLVVSFSGHILTAKAASCEVFGLISSDTTWSAAACGSYTVTGNITVETEVTLTIESGTIIRFDSGKSLTIRGTLVARGTTANYIIFTSNQVSPQKGDWGYIEFLDESTDAVFDANGNYISGNILQYAIVEYAGRINTDNRTAVVLSNSAAYLDHAIIRNNYFRGLYAGGVSGTPLQITNSIIDNNGTNVGTLKGGGLYADVDAISLLNNVITNNRAYTAGGLFITGGSALIAGNTVAGNQTGELGGGMQLAPAYRRRHVVSNNVIRNNITGDTGGGIFFTDAVDMYGNVITGNSAATGGGIYHYTGFFGRGKVIGNTITHNIVTSIGGAIRVGSYGLPIHDNILIGNLAQGISQDIYNSNGSASENINAENNWWGTTDRGEISNRIFDKTDDTEYGVVDFEPFRSASNAAGVLATPANGGSMSSPDGTIQVTVPANAVITTTHISMTVISTPTQSVGPDKEVLRSFFLAATESNSNTVVSDFAQPVSIVVTYTDDELSQLNISESTLTIGFWNGTSWISLLPCTGCSVDEANNRIVATVDHFTEFALFSEPKRVLLPLIRR